MPSQQFSDESSDLIKVKTDVDMDDSCGVDREPASHVISSSPRPSRKEVEPCLVQLNPYFLAQFLFGYFGRSFSSILSVTDSNVVSSLVYTTMIIFARGNLLLLGLKKFPRELVDLYHSIRLTSYRGKSYSLVTTTLCAFLGELGAKGWYNGVSLPESCYAIRDSLNGFYHCGFIPQLYDVSEYKQLLSRFGSTITMCDPGDLSGVSGDVFSFDIKPFVLLRGSFISSPSIVAIAGMVSQSSLIYVYQDSFVGHEFEILSPSWMYYLRLFTHVETFKSVIMSPVTVWRIPSHLISVHILPGVLGHQMSHFDKIFRVPVQLKRVPWILVLNAMIVKIHMLLESAGVLDIWLKAFSFAEIKLLCFGLFRAVHSVNGSASYGCRIPIGRNYHLSETFHASCGFEQLKYVLVPVPINEYLQCQRMYSDSFGIIMPMFQWHLNLSGVVTNKNYTGQSNLELPDDAKTTSFRFFDNMELILKKYSTFGKHFAKVCGLVPLNPNVPSFLDVSILGSLANGKDSIIFSRRKVDTEHLNLIRKRALSIGYFTYTPVDFKNVVTYYSQGYASRGPNTDLFCGIISKYMDRYVEMNIQTLDSAIVPILAE